jgi:hypothetical protein
MWPKTAPNGPTQAKTPPKHGPNMILKARDPNFLSRTSKVLDKKLGLMAQFAFFGPVLA